MTLKEYNAFYLDMLLGNLAGNHAHFEITMANNIKLKSQHKNFRGGLLVLVLVSLIEANFLSSNELKILRNFQKVPRIPSAINQTHLSCFIYIRDCFAHNPFANTLSSGKNTTEFLDSIKNGKFPYASVSGRKIIINETHALHLIVLSFFGQKV